MAEVTENIGENLQQGLGKIEQFVENNRKAVMIGGGAVVVVFAALVYLFMSYMPAQNVKAQDAMFMARFAFEKDSFALALNGGKTLKGVSYSGFAKVADDYSWTKAGKLSNYYAGLCCLYLKKFEDAKKHLEKCNLKDPIVGAIGINNIGDAYTELGNFDEGIKYYEKAAEFSDNERYTPYFLFKAGLAYEHQKKLAEAKKCYEKVRELYPNSDEGRDIEKYIARVSTQ